MTTEKKPIAEIYEIKPKAKDMMTGKEGECVVVKFAGQKSTKTVSWNSLRQAFKLFEE